MYVYVAYKDMIMTFDFKKLRALMVEKDLNARKLAKLLKIPEPTLYNKLNGKSEFKISEIKKISRLDNNR